MSTVPMPLVREGSRLALCVDQNGLTVYANKAGLTSLAERLLRIAKASPEQAFECHTRLELGDPLGDGASRGVSLTVDNEIAEYFLRQSPDAQPDAKPIGFELTFMHVDEPSLSEMERRASPNW